MNSWQQYIDIVSYSCIRIIASVMICFGVGLLTTSAMSFGPWSNQTANTISTDGTILTDTAPTNTEGTITNTEITNTETTNTSNSGSDSGSGSGLDAPTTETVVESSISFVSDVPDETSSNFEVVVERQAVTYLKVTVNGLNLNKTLLLQPISESSSRVTYLVPVKDLQAGKYELRATALNSNVKQIRVIGQRFEVPTLSLPEIPVIEVEDNTENSKATTSTDVNEADLVTEVPIEKIVETEELVPVTPYIKTVIPSQNTYRGFVPVQILTSAKVPSVAIYVQSTLQNQPQFVGSAKYYDTGQWFLMIDTNQIPNGEYGLFAVAKLSDVGVESERRRFVVYNPSLVTTEPIKVLETTEILNTNETPKINTEFKVPAVVVPVRQVEVEEEDEEASHTESNEMENKSIQAQPESKVVLADELKVTVPRILKEYEKVINARLKVYSEGMRESFDVVAEDVKKTEEDILQILLSDVRLQEISPEAKERLSKEIARMVKNAGQVELLISRKEKNKQTEEDFIKEFTQMIVIPEDSLVDVSSPKEFGLVRDDLMKIESVAPIVTVDTVSTTTTVYTEIRGRALPNSLVTLYIYSSPVMVTVRADADGTFVYIYEKDLSDGDHEVYVALTTETGAIAVKSEGFQFIKEAEAFNSPDTQGGDILEPVTDSKPLSSNPYFVVLSFSILFVGLALMFIGLRADKKPELSTVVE